MTKAPENKVLMAVIGAAHGIRGEVRVKPFGDDPLSFTDYGPLETADGSRRFTVSKARVQKSVVVTKFKEIGDRNAAEALNGLELYIPRDRLPETEEDEFYHSDLIGMDAVDADGNPVGKVVMVQNFGAGDLLELRPARGRSFYIPFTRDFVPEISMADRRIVTAIPDGYLSETPRDDGDDDNRIG